MSKTAPAIHDHLASLADTTRSRLLLLLDRHELTVSELCGIMQLPQSTVSRHLKALADGGWVSARADGTSHLYTMTRQELDAPARRLWSLVRDQASPTPGRVAGPAPAAGDAGRSAHEVAGILLVVRGPVGSPARRPLRRAVPPRRPRGARAERLGAGRSRLRHGRDQRDARAVRAARDRGRRVGGDAAGGAQAAAVASTTSSCGAASSKRCRSTTRGSMRRR